MAEVTSLGVHTPVALPYLVAEGLLPENSGKDLYHWETYVVDDDEQGGIEEQLLTTKTCVVWSQGNIIRNVYRFELEGENVIQAVLTQFETPSPKSGDQIDGATDSRAGVNHGYGTSNKIRNLPRPTSTLANVDRALVVLLKAKAHIYFLHGEEFIVDLPFEIEKVFAAPRGLVLQRKVGAPPSLPSTPQVPAPPPNSFFSSQIQPTSSYLQSPTLAKSFAASQPFKPSPLGGSTRLDALFQQVFGTADPSTDGEDAALYSLTAPLSDFGVVTYSLQHHRPRISSKAPSGLNVEFEALDAAERIAYVSSSDELANDKRAERGPLMLIVTVNDETRILTIWHAWYIGEKSLASLLKQRAAHKAAKSKRRSSFVSANVATGTTTPAVRAREGARESFAATGSMRLQGNASQVNGGASSRRPTRQEEEVEMAHQMDPDFQPTASQQNVRDNRRISSLNADVRTGQHTSTSFAAPGGRRNTSFGGPGERRSLGHRKSRGSTPGSVFSRSLGPDDDLMEPDSSFDVENEESIDAIVRHIRATHETAAADATFGGMDETFKRELVVQKIHSPTMPFALASEGVSAPIQVLTLKDPLPSRNGDMERLGVYIRDDASKSLTCLQLNVKQRLLWPRTQDSTCVAVPTFSNEVKLGKCGNIVKLRDGGVTALLSHQGLSLSPVVPIPCPVHTAARYRAYDRLSLPTTEAPQNTEIGKNRILEGPAMANINIAHAGSRGQYDELGQDSLHHRQHLKITPSDQFIERLLEVCQLILPSLQAQTFSGVWMLAHAKILEAPQLLATTNVETEMVAFATTIFVMTGHFVGQRERAALAVSNVASRDAKTNMLSSQIDFQKRLLQQSQSGPWGWLGQSQHGKDSPSPSSHQGNSITDQRDQCLPLAAQLAGDLVQTIPWLSASGSLDLSAHEAATLMLALFIVHQEHKLCLLGSGSSHGTFIAAITAQIGGLLGLRPWSFEGGFLPLEGAEESLWAFVKSTSDAAPQLPLMEEPVSAFMWFEHAMKFRSTERYPSLSDVATMNLGTTLSQEYTTSAAKLTPRIVSLSDVLIATSCFNASSARTVELMARHDIGLDVLETLPEAIAAPFKEAIAWCEREPPTSWPPNLLRLVGRDDLDLESTKSEPSTTKTTSNGNGNGTTRDVHAICSALEQQPHTVKTKEASRHAVSQLIFNEDRRLVEATSLMHYNSPQVAECPKQPDWSDAYHFEQQRRVLQWVTTRMTALPSGDGMLHFDSQTPLLTERYHLSGFSNACVMQPMGHTLTADRSGLTEEKINWAYFHAGVSAGLRITKNAKGVDTSWIAFNKPNDLTNRHAGLLLALGLRGHLRHLAKWLSFKYLTPKHTVTSVGLLLGLSASYMGTMDGLITRMLSVHITRMLPPGAAELNVSAITQTAGLMGIGLLYYNTQHRRMSEIMLSEVEHMELEDPDSGPDPLRDESYRLAAGFALGFVNLGKGDDLRGLSGMHLPERLLAIAVGSRPVSAVHVFDRATAGAVMGIALVYMKSGDRSIARKIDIPDTESQFDHVRPDMLMLRAMAKHVILWDEVVTSKSTDGVPSFVQRNLPPCYQSRFKVPGAGRPPLKSSDVPFFNIVTGLVLALSLKYAGSGDEVARDEILTMLEYFYKAKGSGDASFYYDAKLTRSTVRRCTDVVALAAATVMAGTGDLKTFRYLRRLHGRTDPETPYGSHLAAHLAIGVLFLGGGTYTFGTSNLAVASLLCAFYPLFPTDVHDNHVHLQAFRHFWVFAAEARCLVVEDIDTQRPISMPVAVIMRDGSVRNLATPCLLPELDSISTIYTNDPSYWQVTLDFGNNPNHLAHFKETQRIFVRRCPPSEAHNTAFTATMAALNDGQPQTAPTTSWQSIFNLPGLRDIDKAETELILPLNSQTSVNTDEHGTSVDDRLVLAQAAGGADRDALWNLRMLFAWAEKTREDGSDESDGRIRWMGDEVLETLKARIEERMQQGGDG